MKISWGQTINSILNRLPAKTILDLSAPYLAGNDSHDAIKLAGELFSFEHFPARLWIFSVKRRGRQTNAN